MPCPVLRAGSAGDCAFAARKPCGGAGPFGRGTRVVACSFCAPGIAASVRGVAVRGHKGWGGLFKAKYSLAVSFEAINQDIPIYEPIRTEIEATIENKEIEVEMPDSK